MEVLGSCFGPDPATANAAILENEPTNELKSTTRQFNTPWQTMGQGSRVYTWQLFDLPEHACCSVAYPKSVLLKAVWLKKMLPYSRSN